MKGEHKNNKQPPVNDMHLQKCLTFGGHIILVTMLLSIIFIMQKLKILFYSDKYHRSSGKATWILILRSLP